MSDQKSAMQDALSQFDAWIESNGINKSELFSLKPNISFTSTNKSIKVQSYNQAIDIAKKLEQYTHIAKDFIDANQDNSKNVDISLNIARDQEFLDINKSFRDLVEEGPQTSVEQKLMNAVDTFLSPQEKKQAADQNLSVGSVIKLVEQSIQKTQELVSHTLISAKQDKKEQEQKQTHKEPERKMTSLGEEYGVLHEIAKSISKAFERGRNQEMTKEKSVSKPLFEKVTSDNIGTTLKNMGKDPNHVQDNSKSRSR